MHSATSPSPSSHPQASPLLSHVPGASAEVDGRILTTPWHYGSPLVEQSRVSDSSPGLVDRWDRAALWVSGSEAASWLNTLISQKLNAIRPGQATWALNLDGQGRVLHYFGVSCLAEGILLDVSSTDIDELETYLTRMIFWADVKVSRLELAQLTLVGAPWDWVGATGPDQVGGDVEKNWRTRTLANLSAIDVWVPRHAVVDEWDRLVTAGAQPAGTMAYDAWRINARIPEPVVDLDAKTIPHEVPIFIGEYTGPTQRENPSEGPTGAAVHMNKGCYRGQETVSRVQNIGRPPRQLVKLHIDGTQGTFPAPGSEILADGRAVGKMGSSVHDADEGPIGLGMVKYAVATKLAQAALSGDSLPALTADGIDIAIDPEDMERIARAPSAQQAPPGRVARSALKQK